MMVTTMTMFMGPEGPGEDKNRPQQGGVRVRVRVKVRVRVRVRVFGF